MVHPSVIQALIMNKISKNNISNYTIFAPTIKDYLQKPIHPDRQSGGAKFLKTNFEISNPLVTIITPVLNRKETIERTIRSVFAQTYRNIEYIIIDGASNDGTLDIIKKYDEKIHLWISEPDLNIPDAVNKAISLSSGRYIAWAPSDDWMEVDFIQIAVQALLDTNLDFVFGDVKLFDGDKFISRTNGDPNYKNRILLEVPSLSYPTMVIKRDCFEKIGLLDLNFPLSCDYEWALRLHLHGGAGVYESRLVSNFSLGGVSTRSDFKQIYQNLMIMRRHDLINFKTVIPYFRRILRYLIGSFARLLLPKSIHRKIKNLLVNK